MRRVYERLTQPVHALPVDLFRVGAGLLGLVYFANTWREAGDFASPDGLIDHELVRELWWYTKLGLFHPDIDFAVIEGAYLAACVACALVVVGYRARLAAVFLYAVAVSTYRWNFPVIYVDDSIMHLVFFWLILLPTGRTLTLGDLRRHGRSALERWREQWVPGLAVRCLLLNAALVYVVAGLWKWSSPKWRDGTALHTALQMPISRAPDFWGPEYAPVLIAATWLTLVLEPLIPLMFLLPTRHRLKWALLAAMIGFHVGIIATMKIPYANAALIAVAVLAFREEIMAAVGGTSAPPARPRATAGGRFALAFVGVLALAMAGEATVPKWRAPSRTAAPADRVVAATGTPADGRTGFRRTGHNVFYAPLWTIGIAQSYRLFDWVDDRNWDIRHDVYVDGRRQDSERLLPLSTHGLLLQSYMHGITWGRPPRLRADEFKASVAQRFANRYCRNERPRGDVTVYARVRRIDDPTREARAWHRYLFLRFRCGPDGARLLEAHL